ncbi:GerAB/ArcD/ProY family transporter [Ammoniphilus sp. 3BR4]|uniref:GerAB/ArcD/ProY family transporter n=1 Tax=Ammoniphilus sp. 3BR4 TaxID=3158265 RepID=UPI0034670283
MRLQENVSVIQLLALVINFEIGSAIVVGIGGHARQDAWIAVLMGTALGVGAAYFYYKLLALRPGKNLYEIMEFSFGRTLAIGFSLL